MIAQRVVVGIADMAVGGDGSVLVTHALGSCLGIVALDPVAGVAGMLHVMMPASSINPDKARLKPAMFVDTGVPLLFQSCYASGARKDRMIVKVAGGAARAQNGEADTFQIGKRNLLMLRRILWKNGVLIRGQEVGGTVSRDLICDVSAGTVNVRSGGKTWSI